MSPQIHARSIKTLKRRLAHLESRIAKSDPEKPLTYDISEVKALRYAIRMTEICKEMIEMHSVSSNID